MSNPVPILLDDPACPAVADEGECNPAVALVDLLVCEMQRRVVLVQHAATRLLEPNATASALYDLRMTGSRLAMMGRESSYRASELVNCCRQLHKRLAALEEAVWRGIVKSTFHAEQQGEQL